MRIKGGLGNQLFCYAAARRLALMNGAELVIDDASGFARDLRYKRRYSLDRFAINARKATAAERMEPFGRWRRGLAKAIARQCPFCRRRYLEQQQREFDPRLLAYKVRGTVYLDGLWQSEGYFKDVEQRIRQDLRIIPPADARNQAMAARIRTCSAVAVHVRWFDPPVGEDAEHNVSLGYYREAMVEIERHVPDPHYFLFSDDPISAERILAPSDIPVTCVNHNRGDESAFADLWLMTQCKHFIIANSTFSWWGAWLCDSLSKTIVAPAVRTRGITSWNFSGQLPNEWIRV